MSTTKIRRVPYDLPHAHLYLDDVEELRNILLDSLRNPEKPIYASPYDSKHSSFQVGDDLVMDDIEDLRERGGSTSDFKIEVGQSYAKASISFHRLSNPTTHLYSLDDAEQWRVYSRIKAVFEARKFILKNAIMDLPNWLRISLFLILMFSSYLFIPRAVRQSQYVAYMAFAYVTFLGLTAFVMLRSSRVSFVRSHESSKLALENRKSYVKATVLLALGAIIGGVIQHFVSRWLK